jgi:hypothetical protein
LEDIDEELDYLHYEIIKMMNVGGKKDEWILGRNIERKL